MWEVGNLVVISDLHLGPQQGKGLFQADAELAAFLGWVVGQEPTPCLVINGDFLDFLAPKDLTERVRGFDPTSAAERATLILRVHSQVVEALAAFAAETTEPLVVLGGNHDPELVLPAVQQVIARALGRDGREARVRWLVHGEAARFRVGDTEVMVEHGDLFDDWNRIDQDGLRRALSRLSRGFIAEHGFSLPPGSRLVVDFTADLHEEYPWIDFLKPEREAVVPILHHFLPLARRAGLLRAVGPWFGERVGALATMGLRLSGPQRLVRVGGDEISRRQRMRAWLRAKLDAARNRLHAKNRQELIAELRQLVSEDGYFDVSAPDAAAADLAGILDHGTDAVVHGHTHAAKAYPLGQRGLYLNSGTWAQLLELPASNSSEAEWNFFLDRLEQRQEPGQSRPTFVRIIAEGEARGTRAELWGWNGGDGLLQAAFRQRSSGIAWSAEA